MRLKRFALVLSLAAACSGCAAGSAEGRHRQLRPVANPGAVIAAEIGFAQLAQEKGQWEAFRETAAKDAEMFVPQRVDARDWLKDRKEPQVTVKWQPTAVYSSCDGSYAVTKGAWQRPASTGYFTTVWERDKKGRHKWVLDQGDTLDKPLTRPDFIDGKVADCRGGHGRAQGSDVDRMREHKDWPENKATGGRIAPLPAPLPGTDVPAGADSRDGRSDDGTLAWRSTVLPGGARRFTAWLWKNGQWDAVIDSRVAAPKAPAE